jgi:drug/metabolite transporter (DMT)-like permease
VIAAATVRGRPAVVATGLLAFDVVIWGTTPRVTAVAGEHAGPLMVTSLRAAPTAVALLLVLPLLGFRLPESRTAWAWAAGSGLLMVTVFLAGLTEAVIRAGPGIAIVLASTSPFFVALLERVAFGRRIGRGVLAGLVVGFGGVILVVSSQLGATRDAADIFVGCMFALAGAIGWAIGTLVVTEQISRHPDTDLAGLTTGQYLAGGIVLLALAMSIEGTGGTDWSSSELWLAIAFVSIVGSGVATLAYFRALRTITPTRATAWLFLSPVVAVVLEAILGQLPEGLVLLGMVITIVGVAIVNAAPLATQEVPATTRHKMEVNDG